MIEIIEDKFKGTITKSLKKEFQIRKDFDLNEIFLKIEYLEIKSNFNEPIDEQKINESEDKDGGENFEHKPTHNVVRIIVKLQSKNWWFLNRGSLIFLTNGRPINLGKPVGRNTFVSRVKINNKKTEIVCNEHCVYLIQGDDLKKICEFPSFEIQISGEKWKHETTLDKVSTDYFRLFYNKTFDSSMYTEVENNLKDFEKKSNRLFYGVVGSGCLLPAIFIIGGSIYTSDGSMSQDSYNSLFTLSFGLILVSWVFYFIKKNINRKKANNS